MDLWQSGVPETPGQAEHRLRRQLGQMIATQVVEDAEAGRVGRSWGYHAYNAVLKRALGKARAAMTLAELEAAVGWLERNRVADHLELLRDDHRYEWVAAARRQGSATLRRPVRSGKGASGGNNTSSGATTGGAERASR
jgi:hypothetical protein